MKRQYGIFAAALILCLATGCERAGYREVLRHYKGDAQKRSAAEYLLDNMEYHYSYNPQVYENYCLALDSLYRTKPNDSVLFSEAEKIMRIYAGQLNMVNDAEYITSTQLISHIDGAFERWNNGQYLQHLSFDEFCEYVLPYKCVAGQPFSSWMEQGRIPDDEEAEMMARIASFGNSVRFGFQRLNAYLITHADKPTNQRPNIIPHYHPLTYFHAPHADCTERALFEMMYCRANGLPASVDFVPNWMDTEGTHYWINLLMTTRVAEPFEPLAPKNELSYFLRNDFRMPKVYRMVWKPRDILKEACLAGQPLPKSLSYIFTKDVTDEYCRTTEISVKTFSRSRYVFLAVFDNHKWVPVDIAKNYFRRAKFDKVGCGGTYCLVEYDGDELRQVSFPFSVSLRGKVEPIIPEKNSLDSIRIFRKYPSRGHIYEIREELRGGRLESSHEPDFAHAVQHGECRISDILSESIAVSDTAAYRYWRFHISDSLQTDIAELYFYEKNTGSRLRPTLLGDYVTYENSYYFEADHIIDNDALSFTRLKNDKRFDAIGFDFGQPVGLDHVSYIKRGDGNDIIPGDVYELYYNSGTEWVLVERKRADDIYLDFENVPKGALLYIKCLSRGRQHRIFEFEDGKVFWR